MRERIWVHLAYPMRKIPLESGEQVISINCITKFVVKINLEQFLILMCFRLGAFQGSRTAFPQLLKF